LLEDAHSIQLAIGDVLNALLAGQIDHKTAGLLLYGLQTAASNARNTKFHISTNSLRYLDYTNEEEETLEKEIEQEIAAEEAKRVAEEPKKVAEDQLGDRALPPKKSVAVASCEENPQASAQATAVSGKAFTRKE
jgi:hypothetical protein